MSLRPEMWVVAGDLSRVVMPAQCAACDAETALARSLRRGRAEELLIPYCRPCIERGARAETLATCLGLLACLGALGGALAFPFVWPAAGLIPQLGTAVAVATAPAIAAARLSGGSTRTPTRAVRWTRRGELACSSREFARALARQSGLEPGRGRALNLPLQPLAGLGLLLAVVASCFGYCLHHPALHVLNLSNERLWLHVDGREVAAIEPTLGENPSAGVTLRVPRGQRRLRTLNAAGEVVSEVAADLVSFRDHLYAPASHGHCFRLESTGYGRERDEGSRVVPLVSTAHFWQLRQRVDNWFSPNPESARSDLGSTGGVLTALRHTRCDPSSHDAGE